MCDHRVEITEEEKKELHPADGVSVESMPEAPTETLVSHTDTHTVSIFQNCQQVSRRFKKSSLDHFWMFVFLV